MTQVPKQGIDMHTNLILPSFPLSFFISNAFAEDTQSVTLLDPIVVTGVTQTNTNSVKLNPKTTLQPLPAGDGADLLQSVANMSVIRKGGSSGDPFISRVRWFSLEHSSRRPIHLWWV